MMLLRKLSYAIKNQLVASRRMYLLLAGSLWHKDRLLPSKIPPKGGILHSKAPSKGLWMRRAGSLWHLRAGKAIPLIKPRHRGGPVYNNHCHHHQDGFSEIEFLV